MPRTVWVTGGAGYIGGITCRRLLDQNYRVVVIDNLSTGHRETVDERAIFFKGAVGDTALLRKIYEAYPCEAVFHFAAASQVAESMKRPDYYFENNIEQSCRLIDFCSSVDVKAFIFSSTAATYGDPQEVPILETSACKPINPYGESKLRVEHYLGMQKSLPYVIFRYFNVAGAWPDGSSGEWHEPETHLIPRVLLNIVQAQGQPRMTMFGADYPTRDGTCIRDYVHVVDLSDAHILGLTKISQVSGETFNLGSTAGFSVREVVAAIEKALGVNLAVTVEARREGDPATLVASSEKARKVLGWQPEYESLEPMIKHAWAYFQSRKNKSPKSELDSSR
jgi:UDP-glucose 4-epimerase